MNDFDEVGLTVKFYQKPIGKLRNIFMTDIDEADANFFQDNHIVVSMEEINGDFVVYACPESDETEESEILVFAGHRSCRETMKHLREEAERAFL